MRSLLRRYAMLSVLAMVVAMLPFAVSAAPGNAGGNSAAAQACQNGGYQILHRADGTDFANAGDCASYIAQGGQFQTASLSITFDAVTQLLTLTGSGLLPGSVVTLSATYLDRAPLSVPIGTVAPDGTFSLSTYPSCGFIKTLTLNGTAANGTPVSSPTLSTLC